MAIVIRKNGALNNALAGLAGGLQQGFGMGQSQRSQDRADRQEQRAARESQTRQMAIEADAQRAAQEFAREQTERSAAQDAIAMPPIQEPGAGASNKEMGRYGKMIWQQQEIAKRMNPKLALEWLNARKEETKALAVNEDRTKLVDEIGNEMSSGAFMVTQPDGSKAEDPEITKSLKPIMDSLAKGGDPMKARQQVAELKMNMGVDAARMKSRQVALSKMDAQIAEVESMTPSPLMSSMEQSQKLHTLREMADLFPNLTTDRKFNEQWSDAVMGVEDVGGEKVPIAYAQQARALKIENERLRGEVLKSQQRSNDALAQQRLTPDAPEDPQDLAITALRRKQGARGEIPDEAVDAEVERRTGKAPGGKKPSQSQNEPLPSQGSGDSRDDRRSQAPQKLKELQANPEFLKLSDDEQARRLAMWIQSGQDS